MSEKNISSMMLARELPFVITESYRTARANLMFALAPCAQKIVVVTSANATEGKSTSCANLAVTFADMGKRTLVIDADLRKPTIHRLFELDNINGLSTLISGFIKIEEALKTGVINNLDVMTSGIVPPNPAELLGSANMGRFIESVRNHYDYIFIDTPPINVVMDSQLMNGFVSGSLFIVREGYTKHGDIQAALRQIEMTNGKVLGFLKVGCTPKKQKGYYYKYYK